ncbi:hypothetical protein STENM223S_04259 [Streptomyces tendae]
MTLRPRAGSSPSSRVSASAGDDMSSIISVVPAATAPARRAFFLSTVPNVANAGGGPRARGAVRDAGPVSGRGVGAQHVGQRQRGDPPGPPGTPGGPRASATAARQFGYWSQVPGRFCGRRSPTPSGSHDPDHAGRGAQQVAVHRPDPGLLPAGVAVGPSVSSPQPGWQVPPLPHVRRRLRPLLGQRAGEQPSRSRSVHVLAGEAGGGGRQVVGGGRGQAVGAPALGRQRAAVALPVPLEPQHRRAVHPASRSASRTPGSTVPRSSPITTAPARTPPGRARRAWPRRRSGRTCPRWAGGPRAPTRAGTGPSRGRCAGRPRTGRGPSAGRGRGRSPLGEAVGAPGRQPPVLAARVEGVGGRADGHARARSASCCAQASAPAGCTPTARSWTIPTAHPAASRAARWAAVSWASVSQTSREWKPTRSAQLLRARAVSAERGSRSAAGQRRQSGPCASARAYQVAWSSRACPCSARKAAGRRRGRGRAAPSAPVRAPPAWPPTRRPGRSARPCRAPPPAAAPPAPAGRAAARGPRRTRIRARPRPAGARGRGNGGRRGGTGTGRSGGPGTAACRGFTWTNPAPSGASAHAASSPRSARSPMPQERRESRE